MGVGMGEWRDVLHVEEIKGFITTSVHEVVYYCSVGSLCGHAVNPDLVVVVEVVGQGRPAGGDSAPGPGVEEKDPLVLAPAEGGTDGGDDVAEGGVEVHGGGAADVGEVLDEVWGAQKEDAHVRERGGLYAVWCKYLVC